MVVKGEINDGVFTPGCGSNPRIMNLNISRRSTCAKDYGYYGVKSRNSFQISWLLVLFDPQRGEIYRS